MWAIDLAKATGKPWQEQTHKKNVRFLSDQVNKENQEIEYCKTKLKSIYIFTKPLKKSKFIRVEEIDKDEIVSQQKNKIYIPYHIIFRSLVKYIYIYTFRYYVELLLDIDDHDPFLSSIGKDP